MIPDANYREQHIDCCASCKHNIDVAGIMVHVCGHGEDLRHDSFHEDLREEEDKYSTAGHNYFDQGEFTNQWLKKRWVHEWHICDEYEKEAAS